MMSQVIVDAINLFPNNLNELQSEHILPIAITACYGFI